MSSFLRPQFAIPGLWNMHVHSVNDEQAKRRKYGRRPSCAPDGDSAGCDLPGTRGHDSGGHLLRHPLSSGRCNTTLTHVLTTKARRQHILDFSESELSDHKASDDVQNDEAR
jgi:hypothetical protein